MRKLDVLLDQYGETHQNPVNKAIHWVCVPLIMWSALAAMWVASPLATCIFIALADRLLRADVAARWRSECWRWRR